MLTKDTKIVRWEIDAYIKTTNVLISAIIKARGYYPYESLINPVRNRVVEKLGGIFDPESISLAITLLIIDNYDLIENSIVAIKNRAQILGVPTFFDYSSNKANMENLVEGLWLENIELNKTAEDWVQLQSKKILDVATYHLLELPTEGITLMQAIPIIKEFPPNKYENTSREDIVNEIKQSAHEEE